MRRIALAALFLLAAVPVRAAEPRCPLDLTTCLAAYGQMRERPWIGIEFEADSSGHRLIRRVVPKSPAERAGLKVGDELLRIDGVPPPDWFAGKAGWRFDNPAPIEVLRKGQEVTVRMRCEHIAEEMLTRMIGVHMIEGHLAWMNKPDAGAHDSH